MHDVIEKPVANADALELIAFGRTWSTYQYRTQHTLADVQADGYFDPALQSGLLPGDVINVMTDASHLGLSARPRIGEIGPDVKFARLVVSVVKPSSDTGRVVTETLNIERI